MRASRPARSTPASPRTSSPTSGPRSLRSTPTTSPATSRTALAPERDHSERSLLVLALLAGAGVLALYFAVVRTYWGQRLDEHAFVGRAVIAGRPAAGADELLSTISEGTLVLALVALAVLALLRRRPVLALLPVLVVVGSLAVTEILKQAVLTRPPLVPSAVLDNSFPSGHTTVGIAVGLALMLVAPPRLRLAAAVGAAVLAAAVGIATVAAGWHRPSDAIAAYLVATAVAAAACAAMSRWLPQAAPEVDGTEMRDLRPRFAGLRVGVDEAVLTTLALVGGGLICLALLRTQGVAWTSAGVGFLISATALAVTAAMAVTALVLALGWQRPGAPRA